MADLSVQIGSLKLNNPVLVASGTFRYGKVSAALVTLDTLGGIVTKSVGANRSDCKPPPTSVEHPS